MLATSTVVLKSQSPYNRTFLA